MLVYLPDKIVSDFHNFALSKNLCFSRAGDGVVTAEQLVCACNQDELAKYPQLTIRDVNRGNSYDTSDVTVRELKLGPLEYLGVPVLEGHSVRCESLLSPLSHEKMIEASE